MSEETWTRRVREERRGKERREGSWGSSSRTSVVYQESSAPARSALRRPASFRYRHRHVRGDPRPRGSCRGRLSPGQGVPEQSYLTQSSLTKRTPPSVVVTLHLPPTRHRTDTTSQPRTRVPLTNRSVTREREEHPSKNPLPSHVDFCLCSNRDLEGPLVKTPSDLGGCVGQTVSVSKTFLRAPDLGPSESSFHSTRDVEGYSS